MSHLPLQQACCKLVLDDHVRSNLAARLVVGKHTQGGAINRYFHGYFIFERLFGKMP